MPWWRSAGRASDGTAPVSRSRTTPRASAVENARTIKPKYIEIAANGGVGAFNAEQKRSDNIDGQQKFS
jgi:hypothetical protein